MKWTYSKEILRKTNSFEMYRYRRLLRISWMKKVTNESVRKKIQTEETLTTALTRRKLRYAGHVERGSSGNLAQLAVWRD